MILLCGIPSEPPLQMILEQAKNHNRPYVVFNQRRFAQTKLDYEVRSGEVAGELAIENQRIPLGRIQGVYNRLMDDRILPEVGPGATDSAGRLYCRSLHEALIEWCEITPARVANRVGAMGSNGSKPYQAQLIRENGFSIPETLITNDPELVRAFHRKHGRVIYKSISGVRSIVHPLQPEDLGRLERIRWCPTQFQAFVEGTDIRVHVIGSEAFATEIHSEATDYRYARRDNTDAHLVAVELNDELTEKCVSLSHVLGLAFSGIDLRIAPDGQVYCFEVNPCPAFSYYETETGQPIARAVVRYLAGEGEGGS